MGTLARDDFYEATSPAANFYGLIREVRTTKSHDTAITSQLQDETLIRSMKPRITRVLTACSSQIN